MQTSRITPGNWYVTKQGEGKCLSTMGKKLSFLIDGKQVWLSSSEVMHEIHKTEEPQEKKDKPENVWRHCQHCKGRTLHTPGEAPPVVCGQCGKSLLIEVQHPPQTPAERLETATAYIKHLEEDNANLRGWKESAMPILTAWDEVGKALGGVTIGDLGGSTVEVALREAKALKAMNADLLRACEKTIAWINERANNESTDPQESDAPGFLHNIVKKAKGQ